VVFGQDKFLLAYTQLENSDDKTAYEKNAQTLNRIYGKSVIELETM